MGPGKNPGPFSRRIAPFSLILAIGLTGAILSAASAATARKPAPPAAPAETPATRPDVPPAEPAPPLLHFCAAPVRPACIEQDGVYGLPYSRAACDAEMQRYIRSVFAYRVCLNVEMERAVREVNGAIQRHKCRMAGGKAC